MTDNEFGDLQRAATALRDGLREQAERPPFTPLAADELMSGSAPSGRARWIGVGVGVAAVGSAIALLVPSLLASDRLPAAPAPVETTATARTEEPAAPGLGWQPTSPPPLSPRRDAVTAWVDGSYLIVGGFDDAPCADTDHGDCPEPRGSLRDGARYDPATDTWHPIADAPADVSWPAAFFYPVAVVGSTVYVGGSAFESTWAYDVPADRWSEVPAPSDIGALFAVAGKLVNVPWYSAEQGLTYDSYDPADRSWTKHSPSVEIPANAIESSAGVGTAGNHLVLMANDAAMQDGNTLWLSLIDVTTGDVTDLGWTQIPMQRATSVTVGGLLSWPRGSFDPAAKDVRAWFLDPDTMDWSDVDLPATAHGLSWTVGAYQRDWYITTATAITLRGQLYDPVAKTWLEVPELPVPAYDPVVIGGEDTVLACFGYHPDTAAYAGDCALLKHA